MSEKRYNEVADVVAGGSSTGGVTASAAALLGADLVVVALAWDHPPSEGGIVTITFLMMISFVAFINVMHQIMRSEYIVSRLKLKGKEEKIMEQSTRELSQISKWARYLHVTGLLFTMIAFWIISYKYLISLIGYHFAILLLPFILFTLYWIPKLAGIEKEISILSLGYLIQLLIQVVFLVLICLDFFRILTIP
ncbi:MAG: hypothetical protein ACFE75_08095 [Candidatus Hodarchaeota archaeon]